MIWIDMEMPDNCYCCILCRHADMFCRRLGKMLDRDDCYDERPENCPLHEVTADTDTVSRQAAIELVKDVCDAIMSGCESRYDPETEDEVYTDIREVDAILKCNKEVRIALRNMPSAQTEPQWIPVAERLPENKQEVLVTEYGDTDIGRRFDGRWLDRYGDKMKDVTAWMPKPEPYKEGGAV